MGHYRVLPKFIRSIQELYEASSCQVIHNGKLSEPFEKEQGSPTRLLSVTNDLHNGRQLRGVESQSKTGIQWTLTTQLHDLDYADDICLLSQNLQHMQIKTEHLALVAEKTGLNISKEKTKVLWANSKRRER